MTARLFLILIAIFWCALAGASELNGDDYQKTGTWTELSVSATRLTEKSEAESKPNHAKNKEVKTDAPAPEHKRSRLDGMFDLLLPSSLRDTP